MGNIPSTLVPLKKENKYSVIEILQMIILISVILYFGKTLFIPLSFSFLISIILYPACKKMENKGIPQSLAIGISLSLLILLVSGIVYLFFLQFLSFAEEWDQLKLKILESLSDLGLYLSNKYNISTEQQSNWLKNLAGTSGSNLIPFLKSTIYSLSVSFVFLVLIPIMSALILYNRELLLSALYQLFPADRKETIHKILNETVHTYFNFIKGMLLVYLIVGTLNSIGLALIGIEHPILFGFIASILTFIPYVGILVASLLPISISWITYNSIWYPVGVVIVFTIVQYLEANVIFPFAVSSRLNINTLATIITILIGGILWGASGMILFIPFAGILKLIADKSESLKTLSILLGQRK
jgi:predicted PurR-regulated permease PerM